MSTLREESRRFSPGLIRALSRQKIHGEPCSGCGFPMPTYPGRYPKTCPGCGAERPAFDEQRESEGARRGARTSSA